MMDTTPVWEHEPEGIVANGKKLVLHAVILQCGDCKRKRYSRK
jgi:hypothetical protein